MSKNSSNEGLGSSENMVTMSWTNTYYLQTFLSHLLVPPSHTKHQTYSLLPTVKKLLVFNSIWNTCDTSNLHNSSGNSSSFTLCILCRVRAENIKSENYSKTFLPGLSCFSTANLSFILGWEWNVFFLISDNGMNILSIPWLVQIRPKLNQEKLNRSEMSQNWPIPYCRHDETICVKNQQFPFFNFFFSLSSNVNLPG